MPIKGAKIKYMHCHIPLFLRQLQNKSWNKTKLIRYPLTFAIATAIS